MSKFTPRVRSMSLFDRVADTLGFGGDGGSDDLNEWLDETLKRELKVSKVERDEDGDIPISFGSTVVYLRAVEDEDTAFISVFAPLLEDFAMRPEVYEAVNTINRKLPIAKATVDPDINQIVLTADVVIIDELSPAQLMATIGFVGEEADRYDTLLQKRFGGQTADDDDDDEELDV